MKKPSLTLLLIFESVFLFSQAKPVICVLDFQTEGITKDGMRAVVSLLSSALFQTEKYIVIEVSERENLLKELEFSAGDCADERCFLAMGKLLSAQAIVVGSLKKVGGRFVLSSKMLETETAQTIGTADGAYPTLDVLLDDVINLANVLAGAAAPAAVEIAEAAEKAPSKEPDDSVESEEPPIERKDEQIAEVLSEKTSKTAEARDDRIGRVYLSTAFGLGLTIPLGDVGSVMALGFTPLAYLDINFAYAWGTLGFGLLTGANVESTKPDVSYRYSMLSFPVALNIRYQTAFMLPLYITAELNGGATINSVTFAETYSNREDSVTTKLFLAPTLGFGWHITDSFGVLIYESILMIFFDNTTYLGSSTGLSAELSF